MRINSLMCDTCVWQKVSGHRFLMARICAHCHIIGHWYLSVCLFKSKPEIIFNISYLFFKTSLCYLFNFFLLVFLKASWFSVLEHEFHFPLVKYSPFTCLVSFLSGWLLHTHTHTHTHTHLLSELFWGFFFGKSEKLEVISGQFFFLLNLKQDALLQCFIWLLQRQQFKKCFKSLLEM